ncbi:M48 family metallopeptidase [Microbacterium sp. HA-8]|uniref:M48 family metallopeptidase n=1 Tax=Microbacterium sp. HA-8 TaxID=3234200 RepID=UPI0038F7AEBC
MTAVRARWGTGSILSIALALLTFVLIAGALSPWWLLLPVGIIFFSWLLLDRRRSLEPVSARPADPARHATMIAQVKTYAATMGIPAPDVYVSPSPVGNAFASNDRAGGYICVFQGAIDALTEDELSAVVAHEVGHIKNRDVAYMLFFDAVRRSLMVIFFFFAVGCALALSAGARRRDDAEAGAAFGAGLVAVGSGAAYLLICAGQRSREYAADRLCAESHPDPLALGRALEKLARVGERWEVGTVPVTVAARCIVPPYASAFYSGLVTSHPSTAKRIARLERLVGPAQAEQSRRSAAVAQWEREAADHQSAVEFARTVQPQPLPSALPFTPARGEQLWVSMPALRISPKTVRGETGLTAGEIGAFLLTTERAVFTGPTGKVEWLWAKTYDTTWIAGANGGRILLIAVQNRQRHSGVWVHRRDAARLEAFLDLALAEQSGSRARLVASLERGLTDHIGRRPLALPSHVTHQR